MPAKNIPPDNELIALAVAVNKETRPDAGVSVYRIENTDGSIDTGLVFECGTARQVRVVKAPEIVGPHRAKEIIDNIKLWITKSRSAGRWTTDPKYASPVDYRTIDL